ncbi:MAG TPA: hypothetical protein VND63_00570 [Rhodanobacteraceae bacterium]|nr:hypothetical protein [Rhodanobacteraceae bacterium]
MNTELKLMRLVFALHALLIALVLGSMLISPPALAATSSAPSATTAAYSSGICTPALRDGVVCP